jgi:integrase/recombinase XerD
MSKVQQLSLFQVKQDDSSAAPLSEAAEPTPHSSLAVGMRAFHDEMIRRGLSQHTVKAFALDLKLFATNVGAGRALGTLSSRDIGNYMYWLKHEREVKSSVKSLERRLTTLKVFFKWLSDSRALAVDPAAPILHERSVDPLPKILYDDQITRLLNVARQSISAERPDARPYLLASLLLHTGMKKNEVAGILLEHIDLSEPSAPTLWVRYGNPRYARKERRLTLPKDFADTLAAFRTQYRPGQKLFECSARNLEYVLTNLGKAAGLSEGVSFESLRMTAAVRDYKAGMSPDTMRKKYGLSEITWNSETLPRIKQLAEPAL